MTFGDNTFASMPRVRQPGACRVATAAAMAHHACSPARTCIVAVLVAMVALVAVEGAVPGHTGAHDGGVGAAWLRTARDAAASHGRVAAPASGVEPRPDTRSPAAAAAAAAAEDGRRRLMASCNATREASAYVRSMYASLFDEGMQATRPCLSCAHQQVRGRDGGLNALGYRRAWHVVAGAVCTTSQAPTVPWRYDRSCRVPVPSPVVSSTGGVDQPHGEHGVHAPRGRQRVRYGIPRAQVRGRHHVARWRPAAWPGLTRAPLCRRWQVAASWPVDERLVAYHPLHLAERCRVPAEGLLGGALCTRPPPTL